MTDAKKQNGAGRRKPTQLETLKVYESFRRFRKYAFVAIDNMPRWIKNSEGVELRRGIKVCLRCLSTIARTYDRAVKLAKTDEFLEEWDVISDSILFCFEANGISEHQRDVLLGKREAIEEQVSAFRAWLASSQPGHDENPKGQDGAAQFGSAGPRRESFDSISGGPRSHAEL